MKRITRFFILGLVTVATYAPAKSRTLIITPKQLQCDVTAAELPEAEEHGQTPFRVRMIGGRGQFDWRLPLYQTSSVRAAQIGHAKADAQNSFIIAVTTSELAKVEGDLILEVTSQNGDRTKCVAATAPNSVASNASRALSSVSASFGR